MALKLLLYLIISVLGVLFYKAFVYCFIDKD